MPRQSTVPEAYRETATLLKTFGYTLDPLKSKWNGLGAFLRIRDTTGRVDPDAIIDFAGQTDLVDEFGVWRGRDDVIMPTFGDFVSLFGAPTCVVTTIGKNNTPILLMYYIDSNNWHSFGVVMDATKFSWSQPIYAFSFGINVAAGYENSCATNGRAIAWNGLQSAEHYISDD